MDCFWNAPLMDPNLGLVDNRMTDREPLQLGSKELVVQEEGDRLDVPERYSGATSVSRNRDYRSSFDS